ncbi:uncharacterized protein KY384_008714 [Bacidia gigantensis]|uniref:uncharacterized protein n=1 Tax=Bacidia gigantensis TaxID=2732470 RepID=UPI001D03A8FC|nr:uncharacterized protein KY384_008714 [Bacidia gigantensis]KAG8526514.1 hypothetical protein KY384_008714 [Bacidia gigantensis]
MAPPPPASLPLGQRLIHLAQTLQFGWFVGHLTLLFSTLRYGLSYITFHTASGSARFSYRTAFVAAAATYGIVVYKAARARARGGSRQPGGPLALAADENVQYLAMALIWLFSRQVPLALLPFAVYSVFHVATYTRTNLIPTLQPPQPAGPASGASPGGKPAMKPNALADMIGRFVKEYYDASMTLVASLEIFLWFRLLGSAFMFQKGSWILIIIYTVFFRARYSQSTFVQGAILQFGRRIDSFVAQQSTPPVVKQGWESVKRAIGQAADATDVNSKKLVNQERLWNHPRVDNIVPEMEQLDDSYVDSIHLRAKRYVLELHFLQPVAAITEIFIPVETCNEHRNQSLTILTILSIVLIVLHMCQLTAMQG